MAVQMSDASLSAEPFACMYYNIVLSPHRVYCVGKVFLRRYKYAGLPPLPISIDIKQCVIGDKIIGSTEGVASVFGVETALWATAANE